MNLEKMTILKAHEGLLKKEFSAVELTKLYLEKIEKENKKISAFVTLSPELAISQAQKIDEMIFEEREIPVLAGIPCAIKDNILVEGIRCTAGSKILYNYIAPYDATVVKKLKDKGTVILGKTNLDEFAMGSSTEYSIFGPTRNPYNLDCVAGGSSGGSAAAVAADFSIFSLGSDTGGSIRQPASFCGIVGLKPTYGSVSRYGLIAFASSLDQIGPLTKTIDDCRIVFEAIKGKDRFDATSLDFEFEVLPKIKDLVIGIPKEYFIEGIDKKVEEVIKNSIKKYEERGARIEEITLPHTKYALACYYIIAPAEASSNLARYDGIKYGFFKKNNKKREENLLESYFQNRGEGFGAEVRRRIMLGTYTLSAGYYEAYYLKAQKVRTKICEDFKKAFEKVNVIATPTAPTPAFKIGEKMKNPLQMYLADIFTVSANLSGLPAISIPAGKVNNLPVGLQLISPPFKENFLFEVAKILE